MSFFNIKNNKDKKIDHGRTKTLKLLRDFNALYTLI